MEYVFKKWGHIETLIKKKNSVFLFLDYDGTLVPIKKRPGLAKLPAGTKNLLKKLKANRSIKLAIISGRPLKEIKRLVGVKNIIYAGNHGLELEGPKIKFINRDALSSKKALYKIYKDLKKRLSFVKGALVENKGLSLSVHYRLVNKKNHPKLKALLESLLWFPVARKKIKISHGKMVYEIRPPVNWDKGKIVNRLLGQRALFKKGVLPVCIGDDRTDEDMFKALRRRGISICVGRKNPSSKAGYYLRNAEEVKRFLNRLNNLTK